MKEKTTGGSNIAPSISITSPGDNTSFEAGTSIPVTVNASDSDGTIAKVEFFNNGNKIGENLTSPYTYTLTNTTVGNYIVTAKATDNKGASATSPVITIIVSTGGGNGNCANIQQYVAGTSYGLNDEVVNEGEKFECNISGWCSSAAAWAYAPGTGAHWQLAWTKTGTCAKSNSEMASNNYSVFPTVTQDIVNFRIKTDNTSWVRINLYHLSGKLISTQSFNGIQAKTVKSFTHDLSNLKKGLYVFKIYINDNVYFEKILKN